MGRGFKDALGRGVCVGEDRHICSVHSAQLLAPAAHAASGYYLVVFMELNLKEIPVLLIRVLRLFASDAQHTPARRLPGHGKSLPV